MSINFKSLARQTGRLGLFYIIELRGLFWNLPFNRKRIFSIKVLPGRYIKYAGKGDIAEIIYKNEVLVKYKKSFEYSTLELFSTLLKEGDVIIDVGANSGLYSIFYSKLVGKSGTVHAFEPDVETFGLLKENLMLNDCGNVITYNFALANKESRIEMVAIDDEAFKQFSGDSFKYIKEVSEDKISSSAINAYRLDDLEDFKKVTRIDYIKIDVEGAELLVLEGAIATIKKHTPVIIFELSGKWTKRFDYKPYQVLTLLKDLGYEMDEYEHEQWIAKPVSK